MKNITRTAHLRENHIKSYKDYSGELSGDVKRNIPHAIVQYASYIQISSNKKQFPIL